ncbi:hemicentin-2-like [Penaeus japonicus]|uniref:hemicentin-2-like n=1 Tax=Penaeus japonicus TaxID=27405 RepID=UPI001C716F8F|nr:hemicentin-2-like [Penaeus japonicus]
MASTISLQCRKSILLWCFVYFCTGVQVTDGWWGQTPEFGSAATSVTVLEGETAKLPCIVLHLNDRAVTWLRRRDLHILTAGQHTYSADQRFQVVHTEGSDEWTLVVRYAQPRDAGIYECQVNTDPKLSRPVLLQVTDPNPELSVTKAKVFVANNTASTKDGNLRVEIQGPRELYIEEGSSLTLTCLVTTSREPSTVVYWYHNTNLIDYNSPRGGVNLKIDRGRGETTTRLVVSAVGQGDSGMYSCVPPGSHPATVRVHVQKGDHEAAIQQSGVSGASSGSSLLLLPCLSSLLLLLFTYSPNLFLLDLLSKNSSVLILCCLVCLAPSLLLSFCCSSCCCSVAVSLCCLSSLVHGVLSHVRDAGISSCSLGHGPSSSLALESVPPPSAPLLKHRCPTTCLLHPPSVRHSRTR